MGPRRAEHAREGPPVIVLGGGVTGLGVLRSLGRAGIPSYFVGPSRDSAASSRWHRSLGREIPESPDPAPLAAFLDGLDLERAVLIPCSDAWSAAVARLPDPAAARFPASIAPPAVLDILLDKGLFADALDRLDVPHPRTFRVAHAGDLEVVTDANVSGFFLKPRNSQQFNQRFHVKAFSVRDREEAAARLDEMTAAGHEAVFQEYVPGPPSDHYFIDGFVDRAGRVCALFARRRLRMFPPRFGNSTLMVSVPLEEVASAAESLTRLLSGLGYRGIFSAEFKHDERDGLFKVLEINSRPWWYVEFAALCGVDVCRLAYRDALGLPVEMITRYGIGERYAYLSMDVRAYLHLRKAGELHFLPWVRSLLGARQTIICWDDPLPTLARSYQLLRLAAGRIGRR